MAVPAVIAKAAAAVVTDKKLRNTVIGILLGIIIIIISPIIILTSVIESGSSIDWTSPEIKQQIIDNLPEEEKEKFQYFETVMTAIKDEVETQQIIADPVKAQIIYICVLEGREKDNPNFYSDYVSCFKDIENDDEIFENVAAKFNVVFTEEEKEQIIKMSAEKPK